MPKRDSPKSPKAKIGLEKRRGKDVTLISGLHTYGTRRLEDIAKELKKAFATGGTVKDGRIEIQGDKAEAVKKWFSDTEANSSLNLQ